MRNLLVSLGLMLGAGLFTLSLQAEELRLFRIGTGGIAGTYYPIGGMIAHAISNPPGDRPCEPGGRCGTPGLVAIAQSANGSVANVHGMQQGILESGLVQSDIAYWAYTGTGKFSDNRPARQLRSIANLYPESIHIVVRSNSGIYRVADLVGKRVSLDEPGSGTLIDAELVLGEYGISRNEIEAEYMKADLAIKRIRDNELDAFFIVAGYPAQAITDLARDTGVRLLPIDGPPARRLIERYRFFTADEIPGNAYPGVGRVNTISVGAQWLVAASIENELVYQITRALWNGSSRALLDNGHVKGRSIRLDTALDGIAVPLHPGAKRYYDEIGMSSN